MDLKLSISIQFTQLVYYIPTSGSTKVDNVAILLEHVDLLNGLDGLDVHLLEGGLELLVIGTGVLVDLLDLAAGSTLASVESLVDCFVCGSLGFQVFG